LPLDLTADVELVASVADQPHLLKHKEEMYELVASVAGQYNVLKREEKMHGYAARTALECTRKASNDQAHFILHATSTWHIFSNSWQI